ncbi:MAG: potassium transporter TrkG, partial [Cucumibacter sp.]
MIRSILYTAVNVSASFCLVLAVSMLIPMAVDLHDGHPDWQAFLASALIVGTLSLLAFVATRGRVEPFSLRLGFLVVNLLWASTSLAAALPFILCELHLPLADAVFEAVSGLTTTGSTVITGLDGMPRGILLWRSLTQLIGGIGIIAVGLLLMPFLRIGGMQIFRMESSTKGDSPTPRFAEFTFVLTTIYVGLTVACAIGFMLAGMDVFDAVNHAMTTVATGGFGTHDNSFGSYGAPVLIVGIVFMIAGALPFIALVRAVVMKDIRRALDPQIPVLLGLLAVL